MAEIEPASDELVAAAEAEANEVLANVIDGPVEIYATPLRAILARLRAEQARADKAEADNANITKLWAGYAQLCRENGIEPSSSEVYAAADRMTERADKAEAELARLKSAIAEAEQHAPEAVHFIRAMASTQGGGNG